MDIKITMEPHIDQTMRINFLKIRQIFCCRKISTPSAAKTLTHAYITSRSDYCNAVLDGLPSTKFQHKWQVKIEMNYPLMTVDPERLLLVHTHVNRLGHGCSG